MAAFTSASGSAGTLGAGDRLKDDYGARIVAVEALECPTMLYNGYGEHNIQGIGDKHIPLIHNVMNTDIVTGISDHATDGLNLVFTTDAGKAYLRDRMGVDPAIVDQLHHMGFSSIANMLAAIKTAKELKLGSDDVIMTVATDGSELYESEAEHLLATRYPDGFGEIDAAEIVAQHLKGADTEHLEELDAVGRERIFNLGYYTWVEQQGVSHGRLRRPSRPGVLGRAPHHGPGLGRDDRRLQRCHRRHRRLTPCPTPLTRPATPVPDTWAPSWLETPPGASLVRRPATRPNPYVRWRSLLWSYRRAMDGGLDR